MKKLNPLSSRRARFFYSSGPKLAGARGKLISEFVRRDACKRN
jgi:hypothetical protein